MKVVIDLIEDIREAIENNPNFSLIVMGLEEDQEGNFTPTWQSPLSRLSLEAQEKKIYFFLGKENPITITPLLIELNSMSNQEMMYTMQVSFSKEGVRVNKEVIGFGESVENKQYVLFVEA